VRKSLSDQELKDLALDVWKSRVFLSSYIPPQDQDLVVQIFLPLLFMDKKQLKDLADSRPGVFYEYYEKAMPRSINGYPIFPSFQFLSQDNTTTLIKYIKKLDEKEAIFKGKK
jgi:hypothetical protein